MVSVILRKLASKALIVAVIVACSLANQAGRLTRARELVSSHNIGRNPSHGNVYDSHSIPSFGHSSSRPNNIHITLAGNVTYIKRGTYFVPEFSYFCVVGVGSARRRMVFDTMSEDIWLAEKQQINKIDQGTSSFLYRETIRIEARIFEDSFTLYQNSPKDQISFIQKFFVVQKGSYPQLRCKHYDGVVGLAPVDQSAQGIRNILHSIHDHKIEGFPEPSEPYKLRKQQQNEQYADEYEEQHGDGYAYNEQYEHGYKYDQQYEHEYKYYEQYEHEYKYDDAMRYEDEHEEPIADVDYDYENGLELFEDEDGPELFEDEDEDEIDDWLDSRSNIGPENNHSKLMFSFWFDHKEFSLIGGELTIGGINRHRFVGDIQYYNINSEDAWRLPISRVRLGKNVISCRSGCNAFLDTGIDTVMGPYEDVASIYRKLTARLQPEANLFTVDCKRIGQFPPITINFGSKLTYDLHEHQYIRKAHYHREQVCYINIKGWKRRDWLLGTPFISAYYTVFDFKNRRIGFAAPRIDHPEI